MARSCERTERRSAARGDLRRFLLRLLVLDQLTEAVGNVQTHSASREEYESDQPDHRTHEFFGTDSAWMLKHADDGEGQERPPNNAQDSRNYKNDFPDHEAPPRMDGVGPRQVSITCL